MAQQHFLTTLLKKLASVSSSWAQTLKDPVANVSNKGSKSTPTAEVTFLKSGNLQPKIYFFCRHMGVTVSHVLWDIQGLCQTLIKLFILWKVYEVFTFMVSHFSVRPQSLVSSLHTSCGISTDFLFCCMWCFKGANFTGLCYSSVPWQVAVWCCLRFHMQWHPATQWFIFLLNWAGNKNKELTVVCRGL